MHIMALGNHLRAHEKIDLTCMKLVQRSLKVVAALDRITVEPSNASLGESSVELLLDFFRTCAEKKDVLALTRRTALRNRLPVSAVMAFHAVSGLVEC